MSWFTEDMAQVAASMMCFCVPGEQYYGEAGAVELGRLMGGFVWDHAGDNRRVASIYTKATYGGICKVCYRGDSPIDVEHWKQAVREGYEKELEWHKKAGGGMSVKVVLAGRGERTSRTSGAARDGRPALCPNKYTAVI